MRFRISFLGMENNRQGVWDRSARRRPELRAFSLVEVSVALGIITFGLVSMLGLMPVGLTTMRQAMDASIERQIVQQVTGNLLLTPFSSLTSGTSNGNYSKIQYFDDQGVGLSIDDPEALAKARFRVSISGASPSYPGSSSIAQVAADIPKNVILLHVDISITPVPGVTIGNKRSYNIFVPRSDSNPGI